MATVSINAVMGDNGIIRKAELASEMQRAATVRDTVSMWKLEKELAEGANLGGVQTKAELLADLVNKKLLKPAEKSTVEETGTVTIAGQVIDFGGKTLVDMYLAAQTDNCAGGESCTNPNNHLHLGDYVNYENPTSGTYTSLGTNTGMQNYKAGGETVADDDLNQVYNVANNQLNWRVLGIDQETGGLKLIAGSPMKKETTSNNPYFMMYGAKSYTTGVDELDKICALYKNDLVTKARSVNMDDVNSITGITTENKIKEVNLDPIMEEGAKQYGDAYSYENQWTPEAWLADSENPLATISGTVDGYYYAVNAPSEAGMPSASVENERAYNLLFNNVEYGTGAAYWLASRGVGAYSDYAYFGPSVVYSGDGLAEAVCDSGMFYSGGNESIVGCAVRPVVVLKSDVTAEDIQKIDDKTETTWNYGG